MAASNQVFGYDPQDRLTSWNRGANTQAQSWALSPVGDWQSTTRDGATETRTHNAVHEVTAIDALGRRVQKTVNGYAMTYVSAGAQEIFEAGDDYAYLAEQANGGPATADRPLGGILSGANVIRVNAQPSTTSSPPGYIPDSGDIYGARSSGATYGWRDGTQDHAVEAHRVALLNFDTDNEMQHLGEADAVWEYALPNGDYPYPLIQPV